MPIGIRRYLSLEEEHSHIRMIHRMVAGDYTLVEQEHWNRGRIVNNPILHEASSNQRKRFIHYLRQTQKRVVPVADIIFLKTTPGTRICIGVYKGLTPDTFECMVLDKRDVKTPIYSSIFDAPPTIEYIVERIRMTSEITKERETGRKKQYQERIGFHKLIDKKKVISGRTFAL